MANAFFLRRENLDTLWSSLASANLRIFKFDDSINAKHVGLSFFGAAWCDSLFDDDIGAFVGDDNAIVGISVTSRNKYCTPPSGHVFVIVFKRPKLIWRTRHERQLHRQVVQLVSALQSGHTERSIT